MNDKSLPSVAQLDNPPTWNELVDAWYGASNPDAGNAEIEYLHELLHEQGPDFAPVVNVGRLAILQALDSVDIHDLPRYGLALEQLRMEMGYESAIPAERLLIDEVVVCFVRLHTLRGEFSKSMDTSSVKIVDHWEQRLDKVQRQYLRAVKTLAQVRKSLGVEVQVNIATEGGQQVVANR